MLDSSVFLRVCVRVWNREDSLRTAKMSAMASPFRIPEFPQASADVVQDGSKSAELPGVMSHSPVNERHTHTSRNASGNTRVTADWPASALHSSEYGNLCQHAEHRCPVNVSDSISQLENLNEYVEASQTVANRWFSALQWGKKNQNWCTNLTNTRCFSHIANSLDELTLLACCWHVYYLTISTTIYNNI